MENFEEGSVQCLSGYSVVVINNLTKKVYKRSFETAERLFELLTAAPLDQCALPKKVHDQRYFEFDLVN